MTTWTSRESESLYLTFSLEMTVLASIHFVPDFDGFISTSVRCMLSYLVAVTFPVRMALMSVTLQGTAKL
jgi:hypothetical protein